MIYQGITQSLLGCVGKRSHWVHLIADESRLMGAVERVLRNSGTRKTKYIFELVPNLTVLVRLRSFRTYTPGRLGLEPRRAINMET